jgi:hypothetical protein
MNVLNGFQISITQEIKLCAYLTTTKLIKVTNDKSTLHIEYRKVMMERNEDEHRETKLKSTV